MTSFKRGDVVIRGYSNRGNVVQGAMYTVDYQAGDQLKLMNDNILYDAWKFTLREEFDH